MASQAEPAEDRAWLTDGDTSRKFYFDVGDGDVLRRDETGIELTSEDDVAQETEMLLFTLAHASLSGGRPRLFSAQVRNSKGEVVYEGSMVMKPTATRR